MAIAQCPNCDRNNDLGNSPKMGAKIECQHCLTMLEIVWLDPYELDYPYDPPDDDLDDDFDDDFDD
ncbi:MAG: hypothetical protein MUO76_00915 [Anaerolineaceae bacterium]|nr:hypothetical protein [Anaerolineaceae bacterium]